MNQEKAIELLEKFADKSLSAEEELMLREWIELADRKSTEAVMEKYETIVMNAAGGQADPLLFRRIKDKIAEINVEESDTSEDDKVRKLFPPNQVRGRLWRRVAAAAVILITLGVGSYFLLIKQPAPVAKIETKGQLKNDIPPGGNKAILTLANGQQIILDSAANGTLTRQGNTRVIKLDSGQLAYNLINEKQGEVLYNTISTPRGGQYQIVLADGSKVWLNSASSLKFPTAFSGKERNVELTGEGYFEVAKDAAMPFHVKVNDMQVEVLGTHFNVNAYDDETSIKTTLLEGSVKVSKGSINKMIKPGEQAVAMTHLTGSGGQLTINNNVDIDEVMAWKNGKFNFHNADLETIMKQMARWYDVDVKYNDSIKDHYTVDVSRNVPVSQLFEFIEMSGGVHFEIEGRKIIVKR